MRKVTEDLAFPNGMAVTPNNKTLIVAESYACRLTAFDISPEGDLSRRRVWAAVNDHPDGVCLDSEGCVWYADVGNKRCVRVREGGEILETVELDRGAFACVHVQLVLLRDRAGRSGVRSVRGAGCYSSTINARPGGRAC